MMVRILLLQQWYGMSDEEMEESLRKNLEMMKFVGDTEPKGYQYT